jgi:hypothetical protein
VGDRRIGSRFVSKATAEPKLNREYRSFREGRATIRKFCKVCCDMRTTSFGRARAKTEPAASPVRLIDPRTLPEKGINYHPNHLRRMWQRGLFPTPIRLSPRRIAWPEQVIDDWIAAKLREAEKKSA